MLDMTKILYYYNFMKKIILIIFSLVLVASCKPEVKKATTEVAGEVTQEDIEIITFEKTFGGAGQDGGYAVSSPLGHDFILVGYSESGAMTANMDMFTIKTDKNGEELWSKKFGGDAPDFGFSTDLTSEAGYLFTGLTSSMGAGATDIYLVKTDNDGKELWAKTFGGKGEDMGRSVIQTFICDYLILGETNSSGAGDFDLYLLKVDGDGKELWAKTFGGPKPDYGSSVKEVKGGGFVLLGQTSSFGAGDSDLYLLKVDDSGNELWAKTFGEKGKEEGKSVVQTRRDGSLVLLGTTESYGAGKKDMYLVKTDSDGNELWAKTFGGKGNDEGWSVKQATYGGYLLTGKTESFGTGGDIYFIKTDTSGNVRGERLK
jgi:hypothetical protein